MGRLLSILLVLVTACTHEVVEVEPGDCEPLPAVNELETHVSAGGIELDWHSDADETIQLRIERSRPGLDFVEVGHVSGVARAWTDTDAACLEPNTWCEYRVRPYTAECEGSASDPVRAFTFPAAPAALAVTSGAGQISLQWPDPNDWESGYRVERAPGGTTTFAELATVTDGTPDDHDELTFTDSGLANDAYFTYRLIAFIEYDDGSEVESTAAHADGFTTPDAPSAASATVISGPAVELQWMDNAVHETAYVVTRSAAAGPFVEIASALAPNTERFTDATATADTHYAYRIVARNAVASPTLDSAATTAEITTPPPGVSNLTSSSVATDRIDLAWNNPMLVDAVRIERSPTGTGSFAELATLAPVTSHSDTTVVADSQYDYRVIVITGGTDALPARVNAWSRPAAPTGLGATVVSASEVDLTWTDNSTSEIRYTVEISFATGTLPNVNLSANSELATITGLGPDTEYTFRVYATNVGGDSLVAEVTTATTLAPDLQWTNLTLGGDCTLTADGTATFDPLATFGSADGDIELAETTTATVSGISGALTDFPRGIFSTRWSVTDSVGVATTLVRDLELVMPSGAAMTAVALPTWATGNDGMVGRQVWFGDPPVSTPPCAGCGGRRGSIEAGANHSCAVTSAGEVICWGRNDWGQLGSNGASPVWVCESGVSPCPTTRLTGVVGVAVGSMHTCAVLENGQARCWGNPQTGRLGNNVIGASRQPVPQCVCNVGATDCEADPLTDILAIAAGGAHTCALLSAGRVRCWGSNSDGRHGDGTTNSNSPTPVVTCATGAGICAGDPQLTGAVAIGAGFRHTCALMSNGGVKCWGFATLGQLGDGQSGSQALDPVDVCDTSGCASSLGGAVAISVGGGDSCVVMDDGGAKCWGAGAGNIGDGTLAARSLPTDVCASSSGAGCPRLLGVVAIANAWAHTCALRDDGGVKCWGNMNEHGELGTGESGTRETLPLDVCAPGTGACGAGAHLGGVVAVAIGGPDGGTHNDYSCALLESGGIACWGSNSHGQLGIDNGGADELRPVVVCADSACTTPLSDAAVRACGEVTVGLP